MYSEKKNSILIHTFPHPPSSRPCIINNNVNKKKMDMARKRQHVTESRYAWLSYCSLWTDEDVTASFSAMDLREAGQMPIAVTDGSLMGDFVGLKTVDDALTVHIKRPIVAPLLYAGMGLLSYHHNFSFISQPGFGVRTAVRRACSALSITSVLITPLIYRRGLLLLALDYALHRQDFAIYIDEFEDMVKNPDFITDYTFMCKEFHEKPERWNRVWVISRAAHSSGDIKKYMLGCCECPGNIYSIDRLSTNDFVTIFNKSIDNRHISIIGEIDWDALFSAIGGKSPTTIINITMQIAHQALAELSFESLRRGNAMLSGQSIELDGDHSGLCPDVKLMDIRTQGCNRGNVSYVAVTWNFVMSCIDRE